MSLTGCATEPSNLVSVCVTPVEYSREFQREAADELSAINPAASPHVFQLLQDYGSERLQLRALKGVSP